MQLGLGESIAVQLGLYALKNEKIEVGESTKSQPADGTNAKKRCTLL